MPDKLIISLLKPRNQYFLQLLVISIFIIVFNLNEITFCAGIESETQNNVDGLVYAQETQSIMQPQNIVQPAAHNSANNPESNLGDFVLAIGEYLQ
jgi:hypothetical protein